MKGEKTTIMLWKCSVVITVFLQTCNTQYQYNDRNYCQSTDDKDIDNCNVGSTDTIAGFTFAQINPVGFCKTNECVQDPTMFEPWTIHGLWPTSKQGEHSRLCYCNSTSCSFEYAQISAISGMKEYWPDLTDRSFWCHEWCKHGTCAGASSQVEYFQEVLDRYSKTNFTFILASQGIVPSNDQTYTLKDFKQAFKNYLNVHPFVVCDLNGDQQFVTGIRLCLDSEFNPINCEKHHKKKCHNHKDIYYRKT